MKASDYIVAHLHAAGVRHAFEMAGGMIAHLLDSAHRDGRVRLVSMHHEQGAAFAAEGLARMTGVPGVALATSGPGAVNLLTGVGSCHFDSTPAVFLTGQVNRHEQKGDRPIRQLGFQETDIVAMARPVTKAAHLVRAARELPERLAGAFALALAGRPGPVLLDIPMDVQREELDVPPPAAAVPHPEPADREAVDVAPLLDALGRAERPLILAGGGVRSGRAAEPFRRFVEALGVPVVYSLMAVDVLPAGHPLRVGMIGSYGNRWANLAVSRSDLLLVLGSRLDVRQTGADTDSFRQGRAILHVDCEPGEVNNRVPGCFPILATLTAFLRSALEAVRGRPAADYGDWREEIARERRRWPDTEELRGVAGINPNRLMHELAAATPDAAAYVVDVGQHQMWAAQSLPVGEGQRFLTSGGMGAMGFALPAAVGAAYGAGGRPVVVIAGDGGFQTNIQELQTVARNRLPLKLVVLNNQCHGMVRQFQESYFDGRYPSTLWGYSAPDFTAVARGYGLPARAVGDPAAVAEAAAWLARSDGPALLEVRVRTEANAYPKMAFGRPISEMEPYATPLDQEGT